jgi:hypothetical protein
LEFIRKIGLLVFLLNAKVLELVHEIGVGLVLIVVTLNDVHLRVTMSGLPSTTQHILHLLSIVLVIRTLSQISLKILCWGKCSGLRVLFRILTTGLRVLKYSFP